MRGGDEVEVDIIFAASLAKVCEDCSEVEASSMKVLSSYFINKSNTGSS